MHERLCCHIFFLTVLLLCGSVTAAPAASVQLAWDRSPSSSVTGYVLRYGTQSGVYTKSIDVGNATTCEVTQLVAGQRYYFVVQAYSTGGVLSSPSAEVSWIPPLAPTAPLKSGIDLNGDGLADIFASDPRSGTWSMQFATGNGQFNEAARGGWATGWGIHPADFNADGRTDFLLYNGASGAFYKAINNGANAFSYSGGGWAPGWTPVILDLNGDRRDDVFLYNRQTGAWYKAISAGDGTGGFSYESGGWTPDWNLHIAQFDGNARADLFLYSRASGVWCGRRGRMCYSARCVC